MYDDTSDIAAYYDREAEHEHARLDHHQLEWDLTWRYLDCYLPWQASILEIGSATGRYTLELAKRGYCLTAVDMSPVLLEECKQNITAAGFDKQVQFLLADARDLSALTRNDFDAALLMGPLYHLVEESDRKAALMQAFARLKPGGTIFSAFISRYGLLGDMLKRDPNWIEKGADVRSIIDYGRDPIDYPRGGFRGYFARPSEIAPLHEAVGFETLVLAGVEPAISADDESYNKLEGKYRRLWLDVLYEISTEPSILGASRHLLYIGKKKLNPAPDSGDR